MATNKTLVSAELETAISKAVLDWLNTYRNKPTKVSFESLQNDKLSLTMTVTQGSYITRRFIGGGFTAVYQFSLLLRDQPINDAERLAIDSELDKFAAWCCSNTAVTALTTKLQTAGKIFLQKVEANTRSGISARYENGDEDHMTNLTLTYEVI